MRVLPGPVPAFQYPHPRASPPQGVSWGPQVPGVQEAPRQRQWQRKPPGPSCPCRDESRADSDYCAQTHRHTDSPAHPPARSQEACEGASEQKSEMREGGSP